MQVSTSFNQSTETYNQDILRNCDKIHHLEPNHEYVILEIHKVKTRYGLNYVLVDVDYNKYWSVSKINKFIDENKNTLEVLEIKTNKYITAARSKGSAIKILDLECWNTSLKDIAYNQDYDPDYEIYNNEYYK